LTAEALVLLLACWSRFDLASNEPVLHTFSFLTLLYLAVFSLVSARERRWFFASNASGTLVAALAADMLVGTSLTLVGLPDLPRLPWWQMGTVFVYCAAACLVVNDPIKVALFRRLLRAQPPA
jgi:hypothetical protein